MWWVIWNCCIYRCRWRFSGFFFSNFLYKCAKVNQNMALLTKYSLWKVWTQDFWLWRWLPHRLSKCQSLSTTTILFRIKFTRTIRLNLLLKYSLFVHDNGKQQHTILTAYDVKLKSPHSYMPIKYLICIMYFTFVACQASQEAEKGESECRCC